MTPQRLAESLVAADLKVLAVRNASPSEAERHGMDSSPLAQWLAKLSTA